jgi:[acyl-carrier-protein] S-malonyltransferase
MKTPVYSNALGEVYPAGADIPALLCAQMKQRVRWHDCVEGMLASGVTRFVEIGPGGVLSKMLKRRVSREVQLYSVQDEASLEAFLRAYSEESI